MKTLFGQTLPDEKPIYIALASIYGIGEKTALILCNEYGISPYSRVNQVKASILNQIAANKSAINPMRFQYSKQSQKIGSNSNKSIGFTTPFELKNSIIANIKKLVTIKSYRGFRHIAHLPVRGQRTHSNAHTAKRLNRSGAIHS